MPTPESESFLRQKPKVPPTFQGVDFADNQAVTDARDSIIREQWVQQMMKRLVEDEMGRFIPRKAFPLKERRRIPMGSRLSAPVLD